MFNIGFSEMVLIAVIALIFIGPKELPEIARTLGRFINEMKRATGSLTDEFKENFSPDKIMAEKKDQDHHLPLHHSNSTNETTSKSEEPVASSNVESAENKDEKNS